MKNWFTTPIREMPPWVAVILVIGVLAGLVAAHHYLNLWHWLALTWILTALAVQDKQARKKREREEKEK
jgi:threonine/homoserine efflux transporter RhtA